MIAEEDMTRDSKLDGLKFVLIVLVVLGHLSYEEWRLEFTRFIYSFHMPLFVLLSGYLTTRESEFGKRFKWVLSTLGIYILSQWSMCLYTFLQQYLIHGHFGSVEAGELLGMIPCPFLWYLLSLIFWRVVAWVMLDKISDGSVLTMSIIVAVVSGCIPVSRVFSFQRTFAFFPMFCAGFLCRRRNCLKLIGGIPVPLALVLLLFGYAASRCLPFFTPCEAYSNVCFDAGMRVLQTGLAFVMSVVVIRIISALPCEKLSRFGRYTMWIYIGHAIPCLMWKDFMDRLGLKMNVLVAAVVAVLFSFAIGYLAMVCGPRRLTGRKVES